MEKKNVPSSGCPLEVSASSCLPSSLKSKAYFFYALNSPFSHADLPLVCSDSLPVSRHSLYESL